MCRLSWNLGVSVSWKTEGVYRDCLTLPFPHWRNVRRRIRSVEATLLWLLDSGDEDTVSVNKWGDVVWSELAWLVWSDFVLKLSEMKWVKVKFLGTKVPCTLGWPYNGGTWLYCDYFIWCVSCTVVVLTCFVMCWYVYVGVFWQLCGWFGNMATCFDCVLFCFVCTVFFYCFVYVYLFLFVLSVLV